MSPISCNLARTLPLGIALAFLAGCAAFRPAKSDADLVAVRQLALRGAEAMQRGKVEEAERCFLEAIARQPHDERCHVLLAELRKKQGRTQESTEHLERAVELSGNDPRLLVELGQQFYEQDIPSEAMRCVRQALQQDASSATAWVLYARLLRRGERAKAVTAYHRALQIDPNQGSVAMELAEVYLEEGRLERCLSTLDSRGAAGEAAMSGRAEYLRGLAFAQMQRHGDAAIALAEAERKGIRTPELYYQLAQAHLHSGSAASAQLAVKEGKRLDPADERLAQMETALGRPAARVATRGK